MNIDGIKFKNFIIFATQNLKQNKDLIDSLNVFPVPDGDTGTNMYLTMLEAFKAIQNIEDLDISTVSKIVSDACLKGARGNSGVILSQIFRGFAKGLEGKKEADAIDIANAFKAAEEAAYAAVLAPKEGTILTMVKELAKKANEACHNTLDVIQMLNIVIEHGSIILQRTKDMLPKLKDTNVVDAGAKGLLTILEGAILKDSPPILLEDISSNNKPAIFTEDIKYIYCTEFFINIKNHFDKHLFKQFLNSIGDSIVLVMDENLVKVHVHTNNPGAVLQKALQYGELNNIKIDNMKFQHNNVIDAKESQKPKKYGIIAVSFGKGLNNIFEELNIDYLIKCEEILNPSVEDITNAIDNVNADNIFIFPNNKNVILAAKQAQNLSNSKNIIVFETTNILQAYIALVSFLDSDPLEQNINNIKNAITISLTAEISIAQKDTIFNNLNIKQNNYIAIIKNEILFTSKNILQTLKFAIDNLKSQNSLSSFLTIYYGKDIKKEDALNIYKSLKKDYQDFEMELIEGNQPLYPFLISLE